MRAGALRLRRRGCTAGAGGPVSPAPSLRPWKLGLPPQARARRPDLRKGGFSRPVPRSGPARRPAASAKLRAFARRGQARSAPRQRPQRLGGAPARAWRACPPPLPTVAPTRVPTVHGLEGLGAGAHRCCPRARRYARGPSPRPWSSARSLSRAHPQAGTPQTFVRNERAVRSFPRTPSGPGPEHRPRARGHVTGVSAAAGPAGMDPRAAGGGLYETHHAVRVAALTTCGRRGQRAPARARRPTAKGSSPPPAPAEGRGVSD